MTRILVIRFSSIGDIILSAPVIQALRLRYPDVTVDYLVHDRFSILVSHFSAPPHRIIPFPLNTPAHQLPAFARESLPYKYDLVVDLHNSLRSKIIRKFIRRDKLAIYRKPRLKRWLLFYLHLNTFSHDFSVVQEYLRSAGITMEMGGSYPRLEVDREQSAAVCKRFGLDQDYLVCIPGAAWPQKSWLPERYTQLFRDQSNGYVGKVVFLGSQKDHICNEIAADLAPDSYVNLKGQTNIAQALAVLSRCRLVVGSDTGLVHAAEALGVPVVLILGPTSRETGARTHHPQSCTHEISIWCRPCSQNGKRPCYRKEQYCLTRIPPGEVAQSVKKLMDLS